MDLLTRTGLASEGCHADEPNKEIQSPKHAVETVHKEGQQNPLLPSHPLPTCTLASPTLLRQQLAAGSFPNKQEVEGHLLLGEIYEPALPGETSHVEL